MDSVKFGAAKLNITTKQSQLKMSWKEGVAYHGSHAAVDRFCINESVPRFGTKKLPILFSDEFNLGLVLDRKSDV